MNREQVREHNKKMSKLYSLLPYFNNINEEEPKEDDIVTYFCKTSDEEGFVENIRWGDGGIEILICKKWILQNEIEKKLLIQ